MKIALIVPGGVDRSGEFRVIPALLALIRRLATRHELHVFATHQQSEPGQWSLEGALIHNLGRPNTTLRAFLRVWNEHRKSPFHIVHSIWAGYCGALAVVMGRLLSIPSLVHVAGGELVSINDISYGGCQSRRARLLQIAVIRRADRLTAASGPMLELIAQHGGQASLVPLGVDLQRWPRRHPVRRDLSQQTRLVHVASLNLVKDQATLLNSLRLLVDRGHDIRLDIVGEDTLNGLIQRIADGLGLSEHVRFHGFLTQKQLRPIIEQSHIAVISSRHEAGPLAALEAAAVGVPTIGTAVGHLADWAPHASLVVACRDHLGLADTIQTVIEDEALRLRLAHAALKRAISHDADFTAGAFVDLYGRMLR